MITNMIVKMDTNFIFMARSMKSLWKLSFLMFIFRTIVNFKKYFRQKLWNYSKHTFYVSSILFVLIIVSEIFDDEDENYIFIPCTINI